MSVPALPRVMVAPNGARRTKADHPQVPLTIDEVVTAAVQCFEAGADGLHAHVRDGDGQHVLDCGLYRELIAEMARVCPDMVVQITTEAVGRYSPTQQRQVVRDVLPSHVSVGLQEMLSDGDDAAAASFYAWAREGHISVQHILYSADDIALLGQMVARGVVPPGPLQALFVLGRYSVGQVSAPSDLDPFLDAAKQTFVDVPCEWMVCAFGAAETDCLGYAYQKGGKVRVGFENNVLMADGSPARDNAARVREVHTVCQIRTC